MDWDNLNSMYTDLLNVLIDVNLLVCCVFSGISGTTIMHHSKQNAQVLSQIASNLSLYKVIV